MTTGDKHCQCIYNEADATQEQPEKIKVLDSDDATLDYSYYCSWCGGEV